MTDRHDFIEWTVREFRANHGNVGGPFEGTPILLLHTIGARSGEPRLNPMMYLEDGGNYLVFASKAGSDRNPDWYYNLKANPDAKIEVGDRTIAVHADELTGNDRSVKFDTQAARFPGFGRYQQMTSRIIPVIALAPVER